MAHTFYDFLLHVYLYTIAVGVSIFRLEVLAMGLMKMPVQLSILYLIIIDKVSNVKSACHVLQEKEDPRWCKIVLLRKSCIYRVMIKSMYVYLLSNLLKQGFSVLYNVYQ